MSTSIWDAEPANQETETPPVFLSFGPYLFCGTLLAGNIVQSLMPHMEGIKALEATINQVIWEIPAFIRLTGFNFRRFFLFIVKTFKDNHNPYKNK